MWFFIRDGGDNEVICSPQTRCNTLRIAGSWRATVAMRKPIGVSPGLLVTCVFAGAALTTSAIAADGSYAADLSYCAASGTTCDEFIESVQVGSINNINTTCGNYVDYTNLSTTMNIGTGYPITVMNGQAWEGDQCAIWVDWNHDRDFADAGETIAVSDNNAWLFMATITPPPDALPGDARMRIRITYAGAVDPCGTTEFGEVEDYTITIPGSPLPAPTSVRAIPSTVHPGGCSSLNATAGSGGDTVEWFTGSCGGTLVPGGASPSVCPAASTTYYARTRNAKTGITGTTCASVSVQVRPFSPADFNLDDHVDSADLAIFIDCETGPSLGPVTPACAKADLDGDNDVDSVDFAFFQRCWSGPSILADPKCGQ
jgi:hypothetical protein